MFKILGILVFGVVIGYCQLRLRSGQRISGHERLLGWVVWIMLWAFGAGIGGDRTLLANLPVMGLTALCLGVFATAGSIMACGILQRLTLGGSVPAPAGQSGDSGGIGAMRGSLVTVAFFVAGVTMGAAGLVPGWIDANALSAWMLYLLIWLVGFGLGANPRREMFKGKWSMFLIAPVSVIGTIAGGSLAAALPWGLNAADSVTAVSGMGYYSLSSQIIINMKSAVIGHDLALNLGTIAFIGNIIREIITLLFAPVISRFGGCYALVGAAGVTSLDVTLPSIRATCGDAAVPAALINGIMLEVATPFIVTLASL